MAPRQRSSRVSTHPDWPSSRSIDPMSPVRPVFSDIHVPPPFVVIISSPFFPATHPTCGLTKSAVHTLSTCGTETCCHDESDRSPVGRLLVVGTGAASDRVSGGVTAGFGGCADVSPVLRRWTGHDHSIELATKVTTTPSKTVTPAIVAARRRPDVRTGSTHASEAMIWPTSKSQLEFLISLPWRRANARMLSGSWWSAAGIVAPSTRTATRGCPCRASGRSRFSPSHPRDRAVACRSRRRTSATAAR